MKKTYSEKLERAIGQYQAVEKLKNKVGIQDRLYIKNRQKALVKTREFVSKED
mgnify:CR=1 FL=1